MNMMQLDELRSQVSTKKKALEDALEHAKASNESRKTKDLELKLAQLHTYIKDGWERVDQERAQLIKRWLKDDPCF